MTSSRACHTTVVLNIARHIVVDSLSLRKKAATINIKNSKKNVFCVAWQAWRVVVLRVAG